MCLIPSKTYINIKFWGTKHIYHKYKSPYKLNEFDLKNDHTNQKENMGYSFRHHSSLANYFPFFFGCGAGEIGDIKKFERF